MGFFGKSVIREGDKVIGTGNGGQWRGKLGKALSDQYDGGYGDDQVDCDFGQGKITLPVDMVRIHHT